MSGTRFNQVEGAPSPGRRLQSSSERAGLIISACAGLLGAAGIALAAAGAHRGGGELVSLASSMMLVHAAVVLAVARPGPNRSGLVVAPVLLLLGTVLFSGDLALAGLMNARPWPAAAPIGGTLLMAGWLAIMIGFLLHLFRGFRRHSEERI